MKGQTQALTAVLITAVTVGGIATAYIWGTPLLEKRQSKAHLDNLERDVLNLRSEIIEISKSGEDATSQVTLELNSGDRLRINSKQDYIQIHTQSSNPPYPKGSWTRIKGKSLQNLTIGSGSYAVKNRDLPGIVAVRAAAGAGNTVLNYRVEFRNMFAEKPSGAILEKIDIQNKGQATANGRTQLIIRNKGVSEDSIKVATGEELPREKTVIEVEIQ